MEFRNGHIVSSTSIEIREEENVRDLAKYMRNQKGTANQKIGRVIKTITAWDKAGRLVYSPRGAELVIRPPLNKLDGFTHTKSGQPIFRELPDFRLQDPTMAFHGDGKRPLNSFMQKAEAEITNVLDIRSLSMAFWLGVLQVIQSIPDEEK